MPSTASLLVGLLGALLVGAYAWFPSRQLLRLRLERFIERRVRSNPAKYQPDARVFDPSDYRDDPALFNCASDAVDAHPSQVGLSDVSIVPGRHILVAEKGSAPSLASMGRYGLHRALLRYEGYRPVTPWSLLFGREGRRLALVVFRDAQPAFFHVFWLDGEGNWVSKPGTDPVELVKSRRTLTALKVDIRGRDCDKVGLYWVRPERSKTRRHLEGEAAKAAEAAGRKPLPH